MSILSAFGLALIAGTALAAADLPVSVLLKGSQIDTTTSKRLSPAGVGRAAIGKRFIIQLDGPMTKQRREALVQAGVVLGRPIPPTGFVARLDKVDPAKIAALDFVRWNGAFQPVWKLDPELGAREHITPERKALDQAGLIPTTITLFGDLTPQEIADATTEIAALPGAIVHRRFTIGGEPAISATVRFQDLGAIAGLPGVQWIEEAPEITERNSTVRWVVQSNIPSQPTLWNHGLTGTGQIAGVLDSRIDRDHCSFADLVNPIGPLHRKLLAYNASAGAVAHGTHVAGILAGDSGDFSDNRGMAYSAKIVYNATPSFLESDVYERLSLHHAQGARVHNNSWGNSATSAYDGLSRGVDDFCWQNEDDAVIFAVANGSPATGITNPENAKNCISVGATGDTPDQNNHCQARTGPTTDGRRKPDLFAPGCGILSSMAGSVTCGSASMTGTSMAAPAVTGLAALVRQYYMDGFYPGGAASGGGFVPSGALIKATLINSAVDLTGTDFNGAPGTFFNGYPTDAEGWGRVLADNALYFTGDSTRLAVVDRRNLAGLSTGTVIEQPIVVNSASAALRFTLVWTDPPAAAGALNASVNNLDLEVVAPDASIYRGNVFSNGQSATGGAADTKNNVEQVHRTAPAAGVWTVRVKGTSIADAPQGYALVITGDVAPVQTPLIVAPLATPSLFAPGVATAMDVRVEAVGESIVPGSPQLFYSFDAAPFQSVALAPVSGDIYRASIPATTCDTAVRYYFSASGSGSGPQTAPANAPTVTYDAGVGVVQSTTLLAADFESGLPMGWTTTGLWHVSSACTTLPACNGTSWAYFGIDASCNYSNGMTVAGSLKPPAIMLPVIGPNETLSLSFCSSLGREPFAGFDTARVRINNVMVLDLGSASTAWTTRTIDLSSYAGQNVNLEWAFNSADNFDNVYRGWQVDNIRVSRNTTSCTPGPTCQADFNGDFLVNGSDLSILLANFGMMSGATPAFGDTNGDGKIDGSDLSVLLFQFGSSCG